MNALPESLEKNELVAGSYKFVSSMHGIVLTEILVSMALSSMLVVGVINFYIGFKKQFLISHIKMEEFTEKKLITSLLRHRIYHAGFTPCMNLKYLKTQNKFDENKPINHLKLNQSSKHTLTIQRMNESFAISRVLNNQLMESDSNHMNLKKGDKILIADCYHAETAEIHSINYNSQKHFIQLSEPLSFVYEDTVYFGQFMRESFYLETINDKHQFRYQLNRSDVLTESISKFEPTRTSKKMMTILIRFQHDKTDYKIQTAYRS